MRFAIVFIVLLFACSSPEPEIIVVTATPEPATVTPTLSPVPVVPTPMPPNTPLPADTPVPIPTSTYTPTPTQTVTPEPTATFTPTPIPTSTRVPTYTPRPTNTPRPTVVPNAMSLYFCDDPLLKLEITFLFADNMKANNLNVEILKIYNTKEVKRTDNRLDCFGEVMLNISDGFNDLYPMDYHIQVDPEGDAFIGYQLIE